MKKFFEKTITVTVFDENHYKSRQYTVPQYLSAIAAIVLFLGTGMISFLLVKSYTIHKHTTDPLLLEQTIQRQHSKIGTRQHQLDLLSNKVERLRTKLTKLESDENKIREIARIERSINRESLFGVGGSKEDNSRQSASVGTDDSPNLPVARQTKTGLGYHAKEDIHYHPEKNRVTLVLNHSELAINPMTCIPSISPARGNITKQFQNYVSPLTGEPQFHKGVLIKGGGDAGNVISAPANGIVTFAGEKKGIGKIMIIDHGHGFFTRYANLHTLCKQNGDTVQQGDIIGRLKTTEEKKPDTTEIQDQPALYYEVLFNGVPVNPRKFIANCPFMI
ncbi:MAG: peptidoglycan DD-metalloendopeptidase family protein [Thermodesulfobacteriota bacterium]|nr:peptidoglycan DD-metalloendopeptidase family protein [Thermodesulfobacteriota bacterium]